MPRVNKGEKRARRSANSGARREAAQALNAAAALARSGADFDIDENGMPVECAPEAKAPNRREAVVVSTGGKTSGNSGAFAGLAVKLAEAANAQKPKPVEREPQIKTGPLSVSSARTFRHSMAGTRIGSGTGR